MSDLDLQEDLRVQRWLWKLERGGWLAMGLIVGAAFAGVFGGGPIAKATEADQGGALHVEFDRFVRAKAPASLHVTLQPQPGSEMVSLSIDRSFFDRVDIEAIVPEPEDMVAGSDRITYQFRRDPGAERIEIRIILKPENAGSLKATLSAESGERVELSQLVYP